MTRREASEQYHIPPAILQEYESWGLCCTGARGQYNDEDLQRLSTMMTLHDVGFTVEEVETYMRLLLEQPESGAQRLKMMERRRGETLDEIHFRERQLVRLDYLRREIEKSREEQKKAASANEQTGTAKG